MGKQKCTQKKKNVMIHRKTINTKKSDCEKNDKLIHMFMSQWDFNHVLIHEKTNIKFSFCIFSADIRKLYHQTHLMNAHTPLDE